MNECLTTPQHKNESAIGCQTIGIYIKKLNGRYVTFLVDYGIKYSEDSLMHSDVISIYEINNIENMLPSLSTII